MRLIGTIEGDQRAAKFSDYLYTRGIENNVERDDANRFEVWVSDDDKLAEASQLLQQFMANPESPEYAGAENAARKQRAQEVAEAEAAEKRVFNSGQVLYRQRSGMIIITGLLIVISVCVAWFTKLGEDRAALQPWSITQYQVDDRFMTWEGGIPEVKAGQVWRLVTPIFIHFGAIHLFFNMYWLIYLGGMIERAKGHFYLLGLVLVMAVLSNLAQYYISIPGVSRAVPSFGGMSGVNYALFGYCWMKSKYDFASGIEIHPNTVAMMVVWFVICFAGIMPVANMAHAAGLVGGMVWGVISAKRNLRR